MMTFPPVWKTNLRGVVATGSSSSIRWMKKAHHSEESNNRNNWPVSQRTDFQLTFFGSSYVFPFTPWKCWKIFVMGVFCVDSAGVPSLSKFPDSFRKKIKKRSNFITQRLTIQLPSNDPLDSQHLVIVFVHLSRLYMLRQHPQQKAPSQDQSQMSQRPTHITKIKSLHWPQLPPAGLGWWCVRFQPLPEILKGFRFFRPIGKSETPKTPNLFGDQKIPKNVWDATSVFGPRLEWCVGFFPETERPNVWENLPMRKKVGGSGKTTKYTYRVILKLFEVKNGKSPWLRVEKESTFSLASASQRKVVGCFVQ